MASIPTYLYVGGQQAAGGFTLPTTGFPFFDGFALNYPRFMRVVPSGPDGYSGGTFSPYWDGTLNGGLGGFAKFAHAANTVGNPGAAGDNWNVPGGGGITPCALLNHACWDMHPDAPGYRFLKFILDGGAGTGNQPLKPGGAGRALVDAQWAAMVAAMAPDTPQLRAIILDVTFEDIAAGSVTYKADLNATIAGLRADYSADCLIVLVSHQRGMLAVSQPGLAAIAEGLNREVAAENTNVRLFSMDWAQIASDAPLAGQVLPGPDGKQYRQQDYIEAGARIGRLIDAFYTAVPASVGRRGIAGYGIVGDSQAVVFGANPQAIVLGNQGSLLGNGLGTTREGVYIWNDVTKQVELYDVLSNPNTAPEVVAYFGIELTASARLYGAYPDGVVFFKFARTGISLTLEATDAGAIAAFERSALGDFDKMKAAFDLFCAAVYRDLGRVVDMQGLLVSLGGNDTQNASVAAAFATKAPVFIDDLREVFTTSARPEPLGVVWVQTSPSASVVATGTTYGDPAARAAVRTATANLPRVRERVLVLEDDGSRYELNKIERVHYSAAGAQLVGYDAADLMLELEGYRGQTPLPAAEVAAPASDSPAVDAALEMSPDVLSWTDAHGNQVVRRSAADLVALDKAKRAAEGRRTGIRRAIVRFE